jgi:hypothetical protein
MGKIKGWSVFKREDRSSYLLGSEDVWVHRSPGRSVYLHIFWRQERDGEFWRQWFVERIVWQVTAWGDNISKKQVATGRDYDVVRKKAIKYMRENPNG